MTSPSVERSYDTYDESEPVSYYVLTPDQQNVFQAALKSEDGLAPIPESVEYDVWVNHRAVRHEQRSYCVAIGSPTYT